MPFRLLIDCPDAPGLIHRITGVLFRRGFNILTNQEFVDEETAHFFMRTEFAGEGPPEEVERELRETLAPSAAIRLTAAGRRPIAILATKAPHCLGDLLLRHAYGELPARILAVLSNHDTLRPLAERFAIPFHHAPHEGRDRADHERELLGALDRLRPDFLVLARYMRVLSPEFVARWPRRILNIHHSFLPAFAGANPYRQAFERGVKIIGATAHLVTELLDEGPILAQSVLPVDHTFTAADMAQAGRDVEKIVLAKALRLLLEDRAFLHRNRTIVFE